MELMWARAPELPAYENGPVKVPASEEYVPAISIEGLPRKVRYGDFVTGTAVISPRARLTNQPMQVELLCAERLLRPRLGFADEYNRYYVASKTMIPNTTEMQADARYKFAFSLPVPMPLDSKCENCDGFDFLIPPSQGGGRKPDKTAIKYSVIWFVKVSLVNRLEYTLRDIEIIANTQLPFEGHYAKKIEANQRLVEGLLKKHSLGILSAEAKPVLVNSCERRTCSVNIALSYFPTKAQDLRKAVKAFTVSYSLSQVVESRSLDGFCAVGTSVEPFKNQSVLAHAKVLSHTQWDDNAANLSFNVDLPDNLVLSYSTCLCTSSYELRATIKHAHGSLSIDIPLWLSFAPPSYE